MDLSKGLAIVINSPGGLGLAAERIIQACRAYSGTGEYWAIVPGKAKSAATMICLGAKKILMGPTSELGSIDPQIQLETGEVCSAYNIIKSYEELFGEAVNTKGHIEPYLQQLKNYDRKLIEE
jgi:ClpP class serine protease